MSGPPGGTVSVKFDGKYPPAVSHRNCTSIVPKYEPGCSMMSLPLCFL